MTLPVLDLALDWAAKNPHVAQRMSGFPFALAARAAPLTHRFVFDAEASAYLGRFVHDCGEIIIDQREFALPAYDNMYIEIDHKAFIAALGRPATQHNSPADSRLGWLLLGNKVIEAVINEVGDVGFTPFTYDMRTPSGDHRLFSDDDIGLEVVNLAAMLWGSTLKEVLDDPALVTELGEEVRVTLHVPPILTKREVTNMARFSAGSIRTLTAALLLLNQPREGVAYQNVRARQVIYKGKLRPYRAHSLVKFNLLTSPELRKAVLCGRRESPRRHEVRGHFSHRNLRDGCAHEWGIWPDRENRWSCNYCGGLRWWRNEYLRGDGKKGFVTKGYDVIAEDGG